MTSDDIPGLLPNPSGRSRRPSQRSVRRISHGRGGPRACRVHCDIAIDGTYRRKDGSRWCGELSEISPQSLRLSGTAEVENGRARSLCLFQPQRPPQESRLTLNSLLQRHHAVALLVCAWFTAALTGRTDTLPGRSRCVATCSLTARRLTATACAFRATHEPRLLGNRHDFIENTRYRVGQRGLARCFENKCPGYIVDEHVLASRGQTSGELPSPHLISSKANNAVTCSSPSRASCTLLLPLRDFSTVRWT